MDKLDDVYTLLEINILNRLNIGSIVSMKLKLRQNWLKKFNVWALSTKKYEYNEIRESPRLARVLN